MGISLAPADLRDTEGATPKQLAGFASTAISNTTQTGGGATQTGSGGGDVTRCLFAGFGAVLFELTTWPTTDTPLAQLAGSGVLPDHACDVWMDLTGQAVLYLHGAVVSAAPAGAVIALRWWTGTAWAPLAADGTTDARFPCDAAAAAAVGADVTIASAARALVLLRPFAIGVP